MNYTNSVKDVIVKLKFYSKNRGYGCYTLGLGIAYNKTTQRALGRDIPDLMLYGIELVIGWSVLSLTWEKEK